MEKAIVLLSGGIDSTLIGKVLSASGKKFTAYFAGIKEISEPKTTRTTTENHLRRILFIQTNSQTIISQI